MDKTLVESATPLSAGITKKSSYVKFGVQTSPYLSFMVEQGTCMCERLDEIGMCTHMTYEELPDPTLSRGLGSAWIEGVCSACPS